MEKITKKTLYEVAGLKGMAAIMVIMLHYMTVFFRTTLTGNTSWSHFELLEKLMHDTPLYVMMNGDYAVYIFWVISGFLISYHWYGSLDQHRMKYMAVNKYLKPLGPMFASILLVYILMKLGLMYSTSWEVFLVTHSDWLESFYHFQPNLIDVFYESIFRGFFNGLSKYNCVIWTMKVELLGSLMLIGLFVVFKNSKFENVILGMLLILTFIFAPEYSSFFVGGLVGKGYSKGLKIPSIISMFLFLMGILGGGILQIPWISLRIPTEKVVTEFLTISITKIAYVGSAAALVIGVVQNKVLKKIFSLKFIRKVGERSLYIYLFQMPVLCSFTAWLFWQIYCKNGNLYLQAAFCAMLFGLLMTWMVAGLFQKIMDMTWNKWTKKIVEIILN